jgi:long-chain fatty acid transport protein
MNRFLPTLLVSTAAATGAYAGGVERALTPFDVMFQDGNYVQFSFAGVSPDVSGTAPSGPPFYGFDSGDMTEGYSTFGIAAKSQLTEELSFGVFYEQPYGADVNYPSGTNYYAQGATAELETNAVTAVLKYRFPNDVSIYGGLRYQMMSATADLPYVSGGYTVDGDLDGAWGWLVGVAYEKPEIALRIGLTYSSEITQELDTEEVSAAFIPTGIAAAGRLASTTEIVTPQSVTLDFQSGVAENTLVFGSVRWADWTEFDISPSGYSRLPNPLTGQPLGPLVEYEDDRWTYTLGVGRQLSEEWAVAGTVAYEPSTGSIAGNLGPTDGFTSVGVGVTYTHASFRVTTGLRYVWLGDAETPQGSDFNDNTAIAGGIQIGYSF